MSMPKRYYWMKLKENFMTSDIIDYFMSQPDGANYVVLYQLLCLKTINTGGRLSCQIGEIIIPYNVEKIHRDCKWFPIDTIRVALNLYRQVGLIYEDIDGTLVIADHNDLVGSEADSAERVRNHRKRQKELSAPLQSNEDVTQIPLQSAHIVTPDKEIEIRDKSSDVRDKSKDTRDRGKKADAFSVFAGDNTELLDTLHEFEKMRKSIKKPMTDRAKQLLINKLQRDFPSHIWIEILEQSIKNCWLDIWPIKEESLNSRQKPNADTAADTLRVLHAMYEAEEDI